MKKGKSSGGDAGPASADTLAEELQRLHLSLPSVEIEKLLQYLAELDRWNRTVNLTALTGSARVRRLVTEPIWIGRQLGVGGRCLDIGSGNGCPAIPMAVTLPVTSMRMIEPRLRRVAFLQHIVGALRMETSRVERARIEDLDAIGDVDWVSLQGVALTPALIERLNRVCSRNTKLVWITARGQSPWTDARAVFVPGSETEAWTFEVGG